HERRTLVGARLPDRRRARRPGGLRCHPGHRLHPEPAELRHLRDRRDHRRAARARASRGSGSRGTAVRRTARGIAGDADDNVHAGADRAGAAGADRAVRRGAAADPRHLPAPRRAGERGRLDHVQGVERVTSSSAPAAPARLPVLLTPEPSGASRLRRFAAPITYTILGLVNILVFGLHAHGSATFAFSPQFAKVSVPNLVLPAAATCYVLGGITLALAGLRLLSILGRLTLGPVARRVVLGVVLFAFVVSLIAWADAGQSIPFNVVNLLQGTLNVSIPIMLGALTGVICSTSGVINIAIEGQLLLGAFCAAIATSVTGSLWLGLICGALAGSLVAVLLGIFAISYLVDQVVLG